MAAVVPVLVDSPAPEVAALLKRWRDVEEPGLVRWAEVFSQALSLNATPLFIADIFRKQMEGHPRAWIFTSATLAVGRDFSHYCGELGLAEADTAAWGSPFDYAEQALLYAPAGMPEPNSPDYTERVAKVALPLIRAARGRAFVLCTSLRAMRRIHELILDGLAQSGDALPVLLQGEGSRTELLERFRRLGNAILIGSQSFWEGVDVRGEALSLVVIDKLPFPPPDDPVIDAICERDPRAFDNYLVPLAIIALRQGVGRLIRCKTDVGVAVILDKRIAEKGYGKKFLKSLPPMLTTRRVENITRFLEEAAYARAS